MTLKRTGVVTALAAVLALGGALGAHHVSASDHDDGTTDMKTANLNLTDLYVFTEKSQNPSASAEDLIMILNTNPMSIPRTQFFFNQEAAYDFHVSRVSSNAATPSGKDDVILRFRFGAPDAQMAQPITMTAIRDGQTVAADAGSESVSMRTTPLDATPVTNSLTVDGKRISVFAGLREDPFFFDVEQFLRVRASAAARAGGSSTPQVTFRKPGVDFTSERNVSSIVVRVPRSFLQGASGATTFDVWETISVKK